MAKDKKSKKELEVPEGMKCFKKVGGGSIGFPNRIIKPNQKFWAYPNSIPAMFKDSVEETAADYGAVILKTEGYAPIVSKLDKGASDVVKFTVVKATDENGKELPKVSGKFMYNVVGADGKAINEEPLKKGKANELYESLSE